LNGKQKDSSQSRLAHVFFIWPKEYFNIKNYD
jgi:hypothetical protein